MLNLELKQRKCFWLCWRYTSLTPPLDSHRTTEHKSNMLSDVSTGNRIWCHGKNRAILCISTCTEKTTCFGREDQTIIMYEWRLGEGQLDPSYIPHFIKGRRSMNKKENKKNKRIMSYKIRMTHCLHTFRTTFHCVEFF